MKRKPESTGGANLVTTAKALVGDAARPFLSELGLSRRELEHVQAVASRVLLRQNDLWLVYSNIEASRPILTIAEEITAPDELSALDALLDLSSRLHLSHHERRQYFYWGSRVFPGLRDGSDNLDDYLVSSAVGVVRQAFAAYEVNSQGVSRVLDAAAHRPKSPTHAEVADLESLAAMIGSRAYLRFADRVRRGMRAADLEILFSWATRLAGMPISLPDRVCRPTDPN